MILHSDLFLVTETHIDDNGRDFELLAHNVKNLIETWQDVSDSHQEARTLTKRLEVTKTFNAVCDNMHMLHLNLLSRQFTAVIMNMHTSLAHSPMPSRFE